MRIIGPPSADKMAVLDRIQGVPGVHERFWNEMFEYLWDAALSYRIDPVGVVAQSAKETNWGNFTGKVKPEFYNTAGIKIRHLGWFPEASGDQPLAHQMFPNWEVGAHAHVQHLRAYAGWPLEEWDMIVDPRYQYVVGRYALENFEELGGKWAPAPDYGIKLVELARRLQGAAP